MVGTLGIPEVVFGLVLLAVVKPRVKGRLGLIALSIVAACLIWNISTLYR